MIDFDLTDRESIFLGLPPGGIGAEVGVAWGEFSKIIIANAKPRLMYLIDLWTHQSVEVTGNDPANSVQENKDAQYRQVLGWFLTDPGVRVVKDYSVKAALNFPDGYFDWVFIDSNHLICYEDIQAYWPKVKPGGYLLGHDYVDGGVGDFITVKDDVDRFVAETGLPLLLTDDPIYKCWILER